MVGFTYLLAAASLAPPAPAKSADFRPSISVSAHATARIRVISGARFGQGYSDIPASAHRRSTSLADADGQKRTAELLEFQ